ncbi:MAG: hypothetical protein KDC26_07540 [Armatimonadetes bacterium]|nr:hypothetical protein [Armatimonadota bacterium]
MKLFGIVAVVLCFALIGCKQPNSDISQSGAEAKQQQMKDAAAKLHADGKIPEDEMRN